MTRKGRLEWTLNDADREGAPPAATGVRSIKPDDIAVVFQPIVDIKTGRIFAQEALVRCKLDKYKYPPDLFQCATEEQYCGRLGRMIRDVAFPGCPGVPLFVNVHPDELIQRWLVRPDDPIFFHDHDVYLEITESVPLAYFEVCRIVLKELRTRGGVHLVIDDLGAGYSNLKRIADLEPRVVKLDRELIQDMDKNQRQRQLVDGVVRLCHDLGALVVAEGIETADEFAAVRDSGAQLAQGYFLARPSFPPPRVDPAKVRVAVA